MKATTRKIPLEQIGVRQSAHNEDCWEVTIVADDKVALFEILKVEFKKIEEQGYITFGFDEETEDAEVREFPPMIH